MSPANGKVVTAGDRRDYSASALGIEQHPVREAHRAGLEILTPKAQKRAFAKGVLEFSPISRLIDLGKPIPAYRRLLNRCIPSWIKNRGVFASFEEARAAVSGGLRVGYNHPEIADGYKAYANFALPSDYPMMFWLKEIFRTGSRVFDLGGSVGISFYAWQRYLRYPSDLEWMVCEVPAVAAEGKRLAEERQERRLRFTTQFQEAEAFDAMIMSGSLQYIEPSVAEMLTGLRRPPRHLLINRVPLHRTRSFVTLQNIGWTVSPYRIFRRDLFIAELEILGYELLDTWFDPDHACWIPFYPEYSLECYSGLYFRRLG